MGLDSSQNVAVQDVFLEWMISSSPDPHSARQTVDGLSVMQMLTAGSVAKSFLIHHRTA